MPRWRSLCLPSIIAAGWRWVEHASYPRYGRAFRRVGAAWVRHRGFRRGHRAEGALTSSPSESAAAPKVPVPVWDLPTRVVHWLLVAAVAIGWATAEAPGIFFAVHKLAGYSIGAALIFRVVWGFIGSPHSRFADFVEPWTGVAKHAQSLLRLRPPHSVGHNAIGGWMILALLAVLAVIVGTGLFSASRRLVGPFAGAIPEPTARLIAGLHETAFNVLLVLVTIHVLGVLFDMLLNRENLIGAMITGRKALDPEAARAERPLAPLGYAVVIAAIAIALVAWIAL